MGGKSTTHQPRTKNGIKVSSHMKKTGDLNAVITNNDNKYMQAIKNNDMTTATKMANENQGFERLPDNRLVGYRVSQYKNGKAVSGSDSRQSANLTPGSKVKFSGQGVFVAPNPQYAIDYYAVHDNNVIQKLAFKEADITTGDIHDIEPEVSTTDAEVLDSEVFKDGESPKRLNQIPPITYDAKKNIRPLSQRFNTNQAIMSKKQNTTSNTPPAPPNPPTKPPISNIIPGNINSKTFVNNAKTNNMTPTKWAKHLDDIENKMFELDANNELSMSDDEFNKEIGDTVIKNMEQQKAKLQKGQLKTLPNTGKIVVIGDLHDQSDNLISILKDIQDNPKTNLDKNPDVKIVFIGDAYSVSKSNPGNYNKPLGADKLQDKIPSEIMNRLTTLLMAKYPDQIHTINGNHDIGILTTELYNSDPTFKLADDPTQAEIDAVKNDPNLSQEEKNIKLKLMDEYPTMRMNMLMDGQSSSGLTNGTITNNEHLVDKIKNSSIGIITGDKSKGEKVRLFIHSPLGGELTPGLEGLKNINNIEDILKSKDPATIAAFRTLFAGHGKLSDPQAIKQMLNKLGVDEFYFGHTDPQGFIKPTLDANGRRAYPASFQKDANGNFVLQDRIKKTDNVNSPLGSIEGGANLIDSQHKNNLSGYMVVDLDNNKNQVKQMPDIIANANNDPAVKKIVNIAQHATSQKAQNNAQTFGSLMGKDIMR